MCMMCPNPLLYLENLWPINYRLNARLFAYYCASDSDNEWASKNNECVTMVIILRCRNVPVADCDVGMVLGF